MDFRVYLKNEVLAPNQRILEFGPLIRPTVTKDTHPNVRFADVRSTEEVKKLYAGNAYLKATGIAININNIVDIDYVIKENYKKTFKNVEKFDIAILSNVIEHIPDIIDFFKDIKHVLKKDGRLAIIYPDARFCFDHFRNGMSFADAYAVYKDKNNLSKCAFDFTYNVVSENNPYFFWNSAEENAKLPKNSFEDSQKVYKQALNGKLPDDAHFWPFSDHQFVKFLYDMDRAGLFDFDIEEFYPTPEHSQEFMVILALKKRPGVKYDRYKTMLDKTSPVVARNMFKNKIADLEAKNSELLFRLEGIYKSKRWRYATKLATIKNRLIRK